MLLTYNVTKDFNPDYRIKVIAVQSGSVTIRYLASEGGAIIATAGSISAGEVKEIVQGNFYLRIEVTGGAVYVVG